MNYLHNRDPNQILVCWEKKGWRKYGCFKDYASFSVFFRECQEEDRCFYEMLTPEMSRKAYLDIDISDANEDINVNEVIEILTEIIGEDSEVLVFTSHTENKKSYHIVVDKYCFLDYREMELFFDKVKEKASLNLQKYLDKSVYKSLQQFRILGSHKYQKSNTKIFRGELSYNFKKLKRLEKNEIGIWNYILSKSLVGNTISCKPITGFTPEKRIENSGVSGTAQAGDVEDVLKIFYSSFKECDFEYKDYKEMNGNLILVFKRLLPTYCKVCKRVHENENPFVLVQGDYRNITFYCRRVEEKFSQYLGSLGFPEKVDLEESSIADITSIEAEMEKVEKSEGSVKAEDLEKIGTVSIIDTCFEKKRKREKRNQKFLKKVQVNGFLNHI